MQPKPNIVNSTLGGFFPQAWQPYVLALGVGLAGAVHAEKFDFDGPDYIAEQRVPPPIITDIEDTGGSGTSVPLVVAGRGVGGTQALSVNCGATAEHTVYGNAFYRLPRPLTKADGAQRISVKFYPQPDIRSDPTDPNQRYWTDCGGLMIGYGRNDGMDYQQILFKATFNPNFIDTPQEFTIQATRGLPGIDGGSLGAFVPAGGFYTIIFDFNQDWSQVTNTVITPNGEVRSVVQPHWSEVPIQWLYLLGRTGPDIGVPPAIYDDLQLPDFPAKVVIQPLGQTVLPGWNLTISSTVDGTYPRYLQWYFNDSPLANATNQSLSLVNVETRDAGRYYLVASNAMSCVTSDVAVLNVTNPAPGEVGSVVAWGDNSCGQAAVPAGLRAVAVAAGGQHSLALMPDGHVVAWGATNANQTEVPSGLNEVFAIAGGGFHSLALRRDGLATGWSGDGPNGAAKVPAEITNILAVATGYACSIVLLSDHTVGAWIDGSYPPTELRNVVQIAAGNTHFLALTAEGTVVAWGDNTFGQTNVPVSLTGVKAIAAGADHSLALKSDGTVVSWGALSEVPADLSNVVAVAAGWSHSLALKGDGTVAAWGDNSYGQTNLPPGLQNVLEISANGYNNLAIIRGQIPAPGKPVLAIVSWQNGVAELRITSEPGWTCRIETSTDLLEWHVLDTQTHPEGTWTFNDSAAGESTRFYRASIQSP